MPCVTFETQGLYVMNANNLRYPQGPGFPTQPFLAQAQAQAQAKAAGSILPVGAYVQMPAGAAVAMATVASIGVSGSQWLSWLAPQRTAYISSLNRPYAGESAAAYAKRINDIVASVTTSAFVSKLRAAGDSAPVAITDPLSVYKDTGTTGGSNYGQGDTSTGVDNSGGVTDTGNSGLSSAQITTIANDAAAVLGMAATTITAAIRSGDATQIAQIDADARVRIAALQQQNTGSTSAATQAANQAQINTLNQTIAALQAAQTPAGMSTNTMLMIGAGVLVLGAAAFFMMKPRHNPVIYKKTKKARDKRAKMRPSYFIQARKLR